MGDPDVLIIGSGAGGLAAAVALARAGQRVLVVEQHARPGGWCQSFPVAGHRFNPGVSAVGGLAPGGVLRRLYEGLGVWPDLDFVPLDPAGHDRCVRGGQRFDLPRSAEARTAYLERRFPLQREGLRSYRELLQRVDEQLGSGRMELLLGGHRPDLDLDMAARVGLRPLLELQREHIDDPVLRAVLSSSCLAHGLSPSEVPAVVHAASVRSVEAGAWYPRGGSGSIPAAMIRSLEAHGGTVMLGRAVESAILSAARVPRVLGVRLVDGTEIRARRVLSNADPGVTLGRLVGSQRLPPAASRRLRAAPWSTSGLSLSLVVRPDSSGSGLGTDTLEWQRAASAEGYFEDAHDPRLVSEGRIPGLYATSVSAKDPADGGEGTLALELLCAASWSLFEAWADSCPGSRPAAYLEAKRRIIAGMLAVLDSQGFPGVAQRVVRASLATPLSFAWHGRATRGCCYGVAKTRRWIWPKSFALRTDLPGLWMCGASTVGHGVPAATLSGVLAAADILGCPGAELLDG